MRQLPETGDNRTARSMHPEMYDEMRKGAEERGPSSLGDGAAVSRVRTEYSKVAEPVGHIPRPEDGKSVDEATAELVDKLGERLAFERTGTRLYDGLLSKHDAFGSFDGGPTRADLEQIRRQEHDHFLMLHDVIELLGGDPAAVTPSADVAATASRGIGEVITDPRTSLLQGLEVILIAELADNDSWELLMELAKKAGQDQLVEGFQAALDTERDHLVRVRGWIEGGHQITFGSEAPESS